MNNLDESKEIPVEETTAVEVHKPSGEVQSWNGAAARGLKTRREREAIIAGVLKPDKDFGTIPGCGKKPVLLKPGAEKIADSLNLCPHYEIISSVEDYDKPLFVYRYRCELKGRGTEVIVATGLGSCNSMEERYRWRKGGRACPACGTEGTIIKDKYSKDQYKDGWLCWKNKGGCGTKFLKDEREIIGQEVGRILNDDIYTQVNTIDKMAQKRSLVAATLNLGFSEQFTQDIEDNPESFGGKPEQQKPTRTRRVDLEAEIDLADSQGQLQVVAKKIAATLKAGDINQGDRDILLKIWNARNTILKPKINKPDPEEPTTEEQAEDDLFHKEESPVDHFAKWSTNIANATTIKELDALQVDIRNNVAVVELFTPDELKKLETNIKARSKQIG